MKLNLKSRIMDTLIKKMENISLWNVSLESLEQYSEFVANVNMIKHQSRLAKCSEIEPILKAEYEVYPSSVLYALKDHNNNFIGTVRHTLWNKHYSFAIKDEFDVDVETVIQSKQLIPPEIFHVARLAIETSHSKITLSHRQRLELLKILLIHAFLPVLKKEDNVMIAESDVRIHRDLAHFGIYNQIIGKEKMCLGSYTVPVMNTGRGLKEFYYRNNLLIYV